MKYIFACFSKIYREYCLRDNFSRSQYLKTYFRNTLVYTWYSVYNTEHTHLYVKVEKRAVAKTRYTLLEYGQSKVQGRTEYN